MTCTQMTPAVGLMAQVVFESITVECRIVDVKQSWGKVRIQIAPVSGKGTQWIEEGRISSVSAPKEIAK